MAANVDSIQPGLPVFGSDGEQVGSVIEVRADVPPAAGDAGLNSNPTAPDASGGDRIVALSGLGGKDRGSAPDTALGAQRGDVHSVSGIAQGTEPGAGGTDVLRGYGMPRSQAGDVGIDVGGTLQTGMMSAPGSTGGTSSIASTTERDRGVTDPRSGGYLMVSAEGAPNVSPGGLHVPFSAVTEVTSERVTLDCPRGACLELYGGGGAVRRP